MDEKQTRRFLRRSFRPLGWSLVVYYLIMSVLVILAVAVTAAGKALDLITAGMPPVSPDQLMAESYGNAWGYLLAIAVGFAILLAWKGWYFFRDEVFAGNRRMTWRTFLALTCVFLGCQVGVSFYASLVEVILNAMGLSAMYALEAATITSDTLSMFLYASIAAPIAEELLFRGFIQRSLMPFGKKFAIFGSALLFGMFHGNLIQTPYAILVGLVLGYVTAEYSIWWAILLHGINNMVLADLIPRMLSFLPQMTQDLILSGIIWALGIAGGVILVVKRREALAYIRSESMDRRCLRGFFLNSGFIVLAILMTVSMVTMLTYL